MEILALALVLLATAAILFGVAESQRALLRAMRGTEVSSIADLLELHQRVAAEIGSGLFRQQVAVQGMLRCDRPLRSELGDVPCAAFWYRVERRWEEQYTRRDPDGTVHRETRSGSDRVAGNARRVPFWVEDASGRVHVNPDGATLDTETSVDRFQPGGGGGLMRVGSLTIDLGRFLPNGSGRKTLGYHFHEEILPLDRQIYVLGSANDSAGSLQIGRSADPGSRFLVSLRSRDEAVARAGQVAAYTRYGSLAGGALGLALLIFWVLQWAGRL